MSQKHKKPDLPAAPKGLSDEAAEWWWRIVKEWGLDDAGLLVLELGLSSFDRLRNCQALIKKEGEVIVDRFGQQKANPATTIERDARSGLLQSLKALNLDLEIPPKK